VNKQIFQKIKENVIEVSSFLLFPVSTSLNDSEKVNARIGKTTLNVYYILARRNLSI